MADTIQVPSSGAKQVPIVPQVDDEWTIVLSGPLAQRGPLLAALQRAGADVSDQPRASNGLYHGLPAGDPTVGWVTARHPDLDPVVAAAERAGWVLRIHWPTPLCQVCSGIHVGTCLHCSGVGRTNRTVPKRDFLREIDDLTARLAALESK